MKIDTSRVRDCLKSFDFRNLFVEELGWNICDNRPVDVQIDTQTFCLTPFVEQGGMVIYLGESPADGTIPPPNIRRVIETRITKLTHEHMIIFVNNERTRSVWQWVRRQQGKQTAAREHTYYKGQPGDSLLQKLAGIAFSIDDLDEEGRVAIAEVTGRVTKAFDVEKVTRRFYDEFKKEHCNFSKFLEGMEGQDELSWYTSVMLDRLMFIYFIQKKGFLDGDTDYLANKLRESKARGANQFYQKFLVRLFFEGFAKEDKERSREVNQLLGKVPYLNGGLFLPHQLELAHGENINIIDAAFERLFAFFDRYSWHLDYRPLRADKEIHPDILGYIFEKYVNQKQMGAYYTKEDITDYICKNTVIPFLFDKLESMRYDQFHPFPMDDIEPYIYEAVKQEGYLPTETEREYQARQKRYLQIKEDFTAGKITNINDLITYNLDIRKFAEDWVRGIKDPVTLRAFYFHCLTKVTVLDPAVGSGAFLFAALNMLEPLYEICLDKMEELGGPKYPDFTKELARILQHPNRKYFVLKSIIVNNLFGVDIMEEAVEICKLRLFLQLVAQVDEVDKIEPLPDIDFNIRDGNTLVGYVSSNKVNLIPTKGEGSKAKMDLFGEIARIEQQAANVDRYFQHFRESQTELRVDSKELAQSKAELRKELSKLEDELNHYLASEYGIDSISKNVYEKWLATHHPFHWFVEFYGIMQDGGFDVVIGNPPYVDYNSVKRNYRIYGYKTENCGNLYAYMIERGLALLRNCGRIGMIVPLSLTFSRDFALLRNVLLDARGHLQISSYDNIPDRLFTGAKESDNTSKANQQRVSIFTLHYSKNKTEIQTTPILRWKTSERSVLFPMLPFVDITNMCSPASFPKVGSPKMREFLKRWEASPKRLSSLLVSSSSYSLVVPKTAGYYVAAYPKEMERTKQLVLYFKDQHDRDLAMTLLNSNAFFWFWRVFGDGFDVTATWIGACPVFIPRDNIFIDIASNLYLALPSCTVFKGYRGKDVPNVNFNLRMDLLFRADQWIISHIAPDLDITPEDFLWAKSNSFLKLEVPKSDNYPVDYQQT